ncbi:MAG TPA: FtsX-like permease family protein [Nitrospiraceae bacterium]|nr:FtsX-like permease family protein [Nitrospiraceae bacterium]
MMGFSSRMAWRETRAGWRHFLFFLVCIAVGVGALVTVSVFAANVERTITREARSLMGGDIEVRLSRPISVEGRQVLESLAERGIAVTHASELIAMAAVQATADLPRPSQMSQVVELKAVEPTYPLYGQVGLDPDRPLHDLLAAASCGAMSCHGAVVQESLLIRLGLRPGQHLKIGEELFAITGLLRKEPDRMANAFSLGPRVMISQEGLAAAGLIKPGSRVRERYLMRIPPGSAVMPLVHELRGRLDKDQARVSSSHDAQPQLKRFLDQMGRYLGLVGLTALFVGGIGVATTVHAFMREKMATIAIMKTLGATTAVIIGIYLRQVLLLALLGSLLGAAVGLGLQQVMPGLVKTAFAIDLLEQIDFGATVSWPSLLVVVKGIVLGLLTAILFTLWPLLRVREIRPVVILRRDLAAMKQAQEAGHRSGLVGGRGSYDGISIAAATVTALGLGLLAVWQAGSWTVGLLYAMGLLAAVLILLGSARVLISLVRRMPRPRSLPLRQALGNLHRPGSQTTGIMVAIGRALMVTATVSILERALVEQVVTNRPDDAPTFFFIDIQPDQREGVLSLIHRQTGALDLDAIPLVRSRLASVNGQPVKAEEDAGASPADRDERRKNWYLTREYVLSFAEALPKGNELIKGTWWPAGLVPEKPLISIEEEAAKYLELDVGSTVELEIQGAVVAAEVSSIRKVEWGNFTTNFYMILSPGSIEGAPFTYVATARVRPDQEVPLQQAMVRAFPNVTAINIGDVLDSFTAMLDRLALAIRAVALFSVLSGAVVMGAALSATRYRRLYESVVFKALGATRGLLLRSFASEYALLGLAAGLIGLVLANVLAWGVLRFLFELDWSFHPAVVGLSLASTVGLTLAVGFVSTFRLLGQRPLPVLRHE